MRILLLSFLLFTTCGCSMLRSRYAMEDPVYAQKYAEGANKRNVVGKLKQAIDARHTKYLQGWLISGGAQVRPRSGKTFGTVEVGRELYQTNYFTTRIALNGFAGQDVGSVGVDVGARAQTPTRLAPFVGVGASAGVLIQDVVGAVLDDNDIITSPPLQEERSVDGLATLYPEVGAHFWMDGRIRLTAFGRYLITTQGRDFDDWLVGGQIAIFSR